MTVRVKSGSIVETYSLGEVPTIQHAIEQFDFNAGDKMNVIVIRAGVPLDVEDTVLDFPLEDGDEVIIEAAANGRITFEEVEDTDRD